MPVDLISEQNDLKAHTHEIILCTRKWLEIDDTVSREWQIFAMDEAPADIADYLKDIFANQYTSFLINFGMMELVKALG